MKVIAVIGASRDRRKFGNKAVRAFHRRGYDVVPINPGCVGAASTADREIEGLVAYGSVLDVPRDVDVATLYLQPEVGEQVVSEVATKKIPELWVNPGAESEALLARARRLGLEIKLHCSIVAIGESPADYD